MEFQMCTKCGRSFPATTEFFSRDSSKRDGLCSWCKSCTVAHSRAYHETHKEELAAACRAYRKLPHNKGNALAYNQAYCATHRKEVTAAHRAYYETHKEQRAAYYAAHKEKMVARARAYYETHKEKILTQSSDHAKMVKTKRIVNNICPECGKEPPMASVARSSYPLCESCYLKLRARRRLGSQKYWMALKERLITQGYRCAYTGEALVLGVNDSLDHAYPVSDYPERRCDPTNIEWVTREVNTMKRNRTPEQFLSLIDRIYAYRVQKS